MGTRWNRLNEAVLTSTHNLCFEQKYEKYQIFLSDFFYFLVVKFSIYLNRHVFVMTAFVSKDVAIENNLLLYRILNEQIDMVGKVLFCFYFPHICFRCLLESHQ